MINTIFFDFDGVILESVDIKTEAFYELFRDKGVDIAARVMEYHLQNTGVSRFAKFRYVYKEMLHQELSEEEFQRLSRDFADIVMGKVINAPFVKGAEQFITNYYNKYDMYIASATPQDEINKIVKARGIESYFKKVFGTPTTKNEAVKQIMAEKHLKPENAIFIGDALSDYKAATENMVIFIARISNNEFIFNTINCKKVHDLTTLNAVITAN